MATAKLFKNRSGNVGVIGAKGNKYAFVGGRYWTTNEAEIAELEQFAATGQAGVYIDPNEVDIDTNATSPMEVMKKKIIAEYLEQQKQLKDGGNYEAQDLRQTVGTTADSVVNNNSLAEQVAEAKQTGDVSPALAALRAAAAGKK